MARTKNAVVGNNIDGGTAEVVVAAGLDASGNLTSSVAVKGANYTPKGDQQITIATLATAQSLTVPTGATVAIIQNNTTQTMRWRDKLDGSAPTASVGMRISAGDPFTYDGDLSLFKIIREADGTGTVDISYYS